MYHDCKQIKCTQFWIINSPIKNYIALTLANKLHHETTAMNHGFCYIALVSYGHNRACNRTVCANLPIPQPKINHPNFSITHYHGLHTNGVLHKLGSLNAFREWHHLAQAWAADVRSWCAHTPSLGQGNSGRAVVVPQDTTLWYIGIPGGACDEALKPNPLRDIQKTTNATANTDAKCSSLILFVCSRSVADPRAFCWCLNLKLPCIIIQLTMDTGLRVHGISERKKELMTRTRNQWLIHTGLPIPSERNRSCCFGVKGNLVDRKCIWMQIRSITPRVLNAYLRNMPTLTPNDAMQRCGC